MLASAKHHISGCWASLTPDTVAITILDGGRWYNHPFSKSHIDGLGIRGVEYTVTDIKAVHGGPNAYHTCCTNVMEDVVYEEEWYEN